MPKITQLVCEGERIEKRGCEALELMFSPLPNTAYQVLLLQSLQKLVAEGHYQVRCKPRGGTFVPHDVSRLLFTPKTSCIEYYEKKPAQRLCQAHPLPAQ